MIMPYKKTILVLLVIVSFIAVENGKWFLNKTKKPDSAAKNISDEALDSIMQSYNVALGWSAVLPRSKKDDMPDYASDENPAKEVAAKWLPWQLILIKIFQYRSQNSSCIFKYGKVLHTCHKGDIIRRTGIKKKLPRQITATTL